MYPTTKQSGSEPRILRRWRRTGNLVAPYLLESNRCETPTEREHPLLNAVVLKNLFGCLDEKDLRSNRLVCTQWNQVAIPHLKKRCAPITFNFKSALLETKENDAETYKAVEVNVVAEGLDADVAVEGEDDVGLEEEEDTNTDEEMVEEDIGAEGEDEGSLRAEDEEGVAMSEGEGEDWEIGSSSGTEEDDSFGEETLEEEDVARALEALVAEEGRNARIEEGSDTSAWEVENTSEDEGDLPDEDAGHSITLALQRLEHFIECVKSSSNFPFTNFTFHISKNFVGCGQEWNNVLQTVASFVRKLAFCFPFTEKNLPPLFLPEGITFPQLRSLKKVGKSKMDPEFIQRIVNNAPNLASLFLGCPDNYTLQILIANGNLKLTNLCLQYIGEEETQKVHTFIRKQSEHLRYLNVSSLSTEVSYRDHEHEHPSPTMFPNLKSLKLSSENEKSVGQWLFGENGSMEYAARFPELSSLALDQAEGNYSYYFQPGPPATTVRKVDFEAGMDLESQLLFMENGPHLFPNVKSLRISAEFKDLWSLITRLECLEILYLDATEVKKDTKLDSIFTDFCLEQCKRLRGLNHRQLDVEMENFKGKLEIGPLSALHKIRNLCVIRNDSPTLVTDVLCKLVFLHMRNLERLRFYGSKVTFTQISASVIREMLKKFKLEFCY